MFVLQGDGGGYFGDVEEIRMVLEFRRHQDVADTVVRAGVHGGGHHETGRHGLASPRDGEDQAGVVVLGQIEGQLQAGAHHVFVVLFIEDVFDLPPQIVSDAMKMMMGEGDGARIEAVFPEIAKIAAVRRRQEDGVGGLLARTGCDDVDGVDPFPFLVEGVEGLGEDLGAQAQDRQQYRFFLFRHVPPK